LAERRLAGAIIIFGCSSRPARQTRSASPSIPWNHRQHLGIAAMPRERALVLIKVAQGALGTPGAGAATDAKTTVFVRTPCSIS